MRLLLAKAVVTCLVAVLTIYPGLQYLSFFRSWMFRFYQLVAPHYDQVADFLAPPALLRAPSCTLVRYLGSAPLRVVDFCSGPGLVALELAQAWPTTEVVGLDFSPEMVGLAAKKAAARGLDNVEFIRADASEPGLTDHFDLATVQNGPLYLESMKQAVKPGGKVAVTYTFVFAKLAGRLLKGTMGRAGLTVEAVLAAGTGVVVVGRRVDASVLPEQSPVSG